MIICGIKITHDAAIALIDHGKLVLSYEIEKLKNNKRHSSFDLPIADFVQLLRNEGYNIKDIDTFVFDGWYSEYHNNLQSNFFQLELADYGITLAQNDLLDGKAFTLESLNINCTSYLHAAGHVVGAYCSSEFAKQGQDSFILAWDGGMLPQLYYYSHRRNEFKGITNLFPFPGVIYQFFTNQFEPFNNGEDLETIPGKAMAFAGMGKIQHHLLQKWLRIFSTHTPPLHVSRLDLLEFTLSWRDKFVSETLFEEHSSPDLIATFQHFLGRLILDNLSKAIREFPTYERNLCISGGGALNITWNSMIRDSGIFNRVWVPPFPNDSGNAIGTACCHMIRHTENKALEWNVYSGPRLEDTEVITAWEKYDCSLSELAQFLHKHQEPVVFLNNNAELGPRALGNRSLIAPATEVTMKHLLNTVKEREFYRPVAPICLEEEAPNVFTPGTPDPYMLFVHQVRDEWKQKVPAICHLDGSARLQTVNKDQNKEIYELLTEYHKLSGIPLLCNTSANYKGSGFFPDINSAIRWNKVKTIWSNGYLYVRKGYGKYLYNLTSALTVKEDI